MAAHGLGEPAVEDKDLYRQVIRNRSRNLTNTQLDTLMTIFYDPNHELTVKGISRDIGVAQPTAQRYRNLLLAALESGPQTILSAVHKPGEFQRPSFVVARQNQVALGRANAKIREALQKKRDRLSAEDTSAILDRQIRRLDTEEGDPGKLKGLIDQKMKLEELNNPGQDEVIDPRKVLGKEGLAGMNESYLARLSTLAAHRGELAELWAGICSTVLFTIMDDVEQGAELPEGLNGDVFHYIASFTKVTAQPETEVSRGTSEGDDEGEQAAEEYPVDGSGNAAEPAALDETGDGGSQVGNEKPEHDASYGASQDHAQQPAAPVASPPTIEIDLDALDGRELTAADLLPKQD